MKTTKKLCQHVTQFYQFKSYWKSNQTSIFWPGKLQKYVNENLLFYGPCSLGFVSKNQWHTIGNIWAFTLASTVCLLVFSYQVSTFPTVIYNQVPLFSNAITLHCCVQCYLGFIVEERESIYLSACKLFSQLYRATFSKKKIWIIFLCLEYHQPKKLFNPITPAFFMGTWQITFCRGHGVILEVQETFNCFWTPCMTCVPSSVQCSAKNVNRRRPWLANGHKGGYFPYPGGFRFAITRSRSSSSSIVVTEGFQGLET